MGNSRRLVLLRSYALAFAVVLSPAFLQQVPCIRGNADLLSLELEVDGGPNLIVGFDPLVRSYDVSTSGSTVTVRADALINSSTVNWVWRVGGVAIGGAEIGVDGGEVTLPISIPDGQSELGIAVRIPPSMGTATALYKINIERVPPELHSCDEDGIREAIADGGGPHTFDCQGPTIVPTGSEIVIDNDVTLDGEGNLIVDGGNDHRVFQVAFFATVELRGVTVTGGALDGSAIGAGIHNDGTLTLTRCDVSGNATTNRGGGIWSSGDMTLVSTTVSGNSAAVAGGGIFTNGPTFALIESTISGNSSDTGAGIFHIWGETLIKNSTLSGNIASGDGGAFASWANGPADLRVENSTISGNTAVTNGNAFYHSGTTANLSLLNSTVVGNTGSSTTIRYGGPIDGLVLRNSVLEGSCIYYTATPNARYTIESPADTCGLPPTSGNLVNVSAGKLDLGPLQDNGGPTHTHEPSGGSVAIDATPTAECRDADGMLLPSDQRGVARPQGWACDTGAVEVAADEIWPTDTPESQGFDSDALASFIEGIEGTGVDSLLVIRNGVMVLDAYFYPYLGDRPHDVASVTKTVTSTLTGIAIDQGFVQDVDQLVMPVFAEDYPDILAVGGKEDITFEHLLTLTSGLDCGVSDGASILQMLSSADWVRHVLERDMINPPGTAYVYCSPAVHLLGAAAIEPSGQSALEFAEQYLFSPLGIGDAGWHWPTDPQGIVHGWGDLRLHPYAMARFGQMFLDQGMWNQTQVVSSEWVERATQPQPMRYLWWQPPFFENAYAAAGRGGQHIIVQPDRNLVVVATGSLDINLWWAPDFLDTLVSDVALPPNQDAYQRLMTAVTEATMPPLPLDPVPALPPIAMDVSGRVYELDANQFGVQCYAVHFDSANPSEASVDLTMLGQDGTLEEFNLPIGMDGVPRFSEIQPRGFQVGVVGDWATSDRFDLLYDDLAGVTHLSVVSWFGADVANVRIDFIDRTAYFDPQTVWGYWVDTGICPALP